MNQLSLVAVVLYGAGIMAPDGLAAKEFPLVAKRVLFLGDSITNSGHYVADIETQLRIQGLRDVPEFINIGLSSETCTGLSEPDHPFPRPNIHERLDRALQLLKPDVVVACYGMNDGIYSPFDARRFQTFQEGMSKLVSKSQASGAKVVVLTPPPFDPLPLRDHPGKLVGIGAEKYAWFAVYDKYDEVIRQYSDWIRRNEFSADMVIDIHSPILNEIAERRRDNPMFRVAEDGVHMNRTGHEFMARAILKAWGVESWETPQADLRELVTKKTNVVHDAWLSRVGHLRPNVKPGLPLDEALKRAAKLQEQIEALVESLQSPRVSQRSTADGTVYSVHYPAGIEDGQLRLFVDYDLWIPEGVDTIHGVIVHQHGCGPGASIGGQTVVDDLHWQVLAKRNRCALMGSSYEPRKGVNCRLWCDARRGSASRFLEAINLLAATANHPEVDSAPWCLWGHSGGGFWASLMQTLYPQRIVAIWLQSGTAYPYWERDEIMRPKIPQAAFGVPVLATPGQKEEAHERFHTAFDGSLAMQKAYKAAGAPFFKVAPDPRTGHECGDSRYLAIPFFNFWLQRRVRRGDALKPVDSVDLQEWAELMQPKLDEFLQTGAVSDTSPPSPPTNVRATIVNEGSVTITWNATADFESGLSAFVISRNGVDIARLPTTGSGRFGRPIFQKMSYHDTPELPLPNMEFVDTHATGDGAIYSVRAINSVMLESESTAAGR